MVNETSPIIDFYPEEFKCDLNGKQQEWEAVVLIPFIDEERLLTAMAPLLSHLKPEEKSSTKSLTIMNYTTFHDINIFRKQAWCHQCVSVHT